MTMTTAKTKAERDAMREANPEINELLYARYHEADNADYHDDAGHEEHGDYMDELQDQISDIVGEENFDAIWEDYEAERSTPMAGQTVQEQIEATVGHVVGAIYALKAGILGEFSDAGDTGIVEVRIENGNILGVWVARLDAAHPEIAPGVRAGWKMTPDDIAGMKRAS